MSLILPKYGDDTRCLQDIDEVGTTDQNILDLVTRSNEDASLELESIFNGLIPFHLIETAEELEPWFRQLAIELQVSYFWVKSNNTPEAKTQREEVREKADKILIKRFAPAFVV